MSQLVTHSVFIFILTSIFTFSASAAPNTINKRVVYQGFLTNSSGTPLSDGGYKMRFTIKHDNSSVWQKTYNTVTLTMGIFNVSFSGNDDSAVAFAASMFSLSNGAVSMNVDVEVDVDGDGSFDNTFSAIPLSAVPTAMVAEMCNVSGTDSVSTSSVQNGAITAAKMTAGDYSSVINSGNYTINIIGNVTGNADSATNAGNVTGTVAVANGGTGAVNATNARTNLAAAKSGANSDITSLTGLTTALSVGQGGTGATTAAAALTSLGAATAGANSDITSLSGLTTPLSVAQGGTGSNTQNYVDLTTAQNSIGGDKTFTGVVSLSSAGTALSVTNNATIGGTLASTGLGTFTVGVKVKNAGAGSTTLDHYEENTCTAVISGVTTAGAGTYSTNTCIFTRVGRMVYVQAVWIWTAHTGTGNMRITGLPYAGNANLEQICKLGWSGVTFAAGNGLKARIPASQTYADILNDPATNTAEVAIPIDTNATLRLNCAYSM
jgi:hypothetical protein